LIVSSSKLTPFFPLSNLLDNKKQEVILFERGRDYVRGRSPLSPTLPSPATIIRVS
jgi:hypothetical protein